MNKYIERYIPMVDFIADIMGDNTEVILHDVTDCSNSVVAIRNNHISGRTVGAPLTDLGLRILKEANDTKRNYLAGYVGYSKDGNKTKSSTWLIRDDDDVIVGMLCVNSDYSELTRAVDVLNNFLGKQHLPSAPQVEEQTEYFNMSVTDLVDNNLKKVWPDLGEGRTKLSQKEKVEIVTRLYEMGTFYMKGSVACVAERIGSSIPTVYRYLNSLKKNAE